jgi:hypothetical protein
LADLYVCWNKNALYLGLHAQDVVEDVFYRGKTVPASDRAEWTVHLGTRAQPVRARIGTGREPTVDEPTVRIVGISGLNGNLRSIAALEIPVELFDRHGFRKGDTVAIQSTLVTHCRAYRVEWQGRFSLLGK